MIERPQELVELLQNDTFKVAERDEAEMRQYMAVASSLLKGAKNPNTSAYGRYMLADDGIYSLAMAALLHYAVRPSDQGGHRGMALQKFCDFLELDLGMRKVVLNAHDRRNEKTYRAALPSLTHKDAEAVIAALEVVIQKTTALVTFSAP